MAKVIFSRRARKDIKKLDPVLRKKLGKKIQTFSQNPLRYARKLSDKSIGQYRWKTGRYRITFDLQHNEIQILRVRHRKEVYK